MARTDAVPFFLELAAEWRRLGAEVTFEPGWERRGNGMSPAYEGGLVHHTAFLSSFASPFPALGTLINGRPDLSGPLCNVGGPVCPVNRPRLHIIAAFPANHAGASGGRSMGPLPVTTLFNRHVVGLEIDYAGLTPMIGGQRLAALIFARGLANVLGRSIEYVRAHAETSISGKWDIGAGTGKVQTADMAAFRRDAATLTTTGGFLSMLSDAQQDELFMKVQSIYSWLRGGDPKLDNISLLWLSDKVQTAGIQEIKSILLGATPQDGDRLADIWAALTQVLASTGGAVDADALAAKVVDGVGQKLASEFLAELVKLISAPATPTSA